MPSRANLRHLSGGIKPPIRYTKPLSLPCASFNRSIPSHVHLLSRSFTSTASTRNIPSWPSPPIPQNPIMPSDDLSSSSKPSGSGSGLGNEKKRSWYSDWAHSPSFQAALTTVVGLAMVFGAGVGYLQWYKAHVLRRVSLSYLLRSLKNDGWARSSWHDRLDRKCVQGRIRKSLKFIYQYSAELGFELLMLIVGSSSWTFNVTCS